jgi:hypothetical protein
VNAGKQQAVALQVQSWLEPQEVHSQGAAPEASQHDSQHHHQQQQQQQRPPLPDLLQQQRYLAGQQYLLQQRRDDLCVLLGRAQAVHAALQDGHGTKQPVSEEAAEAAAEALHFSDDEGDGAQDDDGNSVASWEQGWGAEDVGEDFGLGVDDGSVGAGDSAAADDGSDMELGDRGAVGMDDAAAAASAQGGVYAADDDDMVDAPSPSPPPEPAPVLQQVSLCQCLGQGLAVADLYLLSDGVWPWTCVRRRGGYISTRHQL